MIVGQENNAMVSAQLFLYVKRQRLDVDHVQSEAYTLPTGQATGTKGGICTAAVPYCLEDTPISR